MFKDNLVGKTIYFSLFVQVITTLVSIDGLRYDLNDRDKILKDILILEPLVQIVEAIFYVWVVAALKDIDLMAPRRYIDWFITTPTMLLSTILFFSYNTHLDEEKGITFTEIIENNKEKLIKIFLLNAGMLIFGLLGELETIPLIMSNILGFICFAFLFKEVYSFVGPNKENKQLYTFFLIVWSFYGIAQLLPTLEKNISYNFLDVVAKNFYGLFIYYKLRQVAV